MNENPVKARLARRKKSRKAGDIEALRQTLHAPPEMSTKYRLRRIERTIKVSTDTEAGSVYSIILPAPDGSALVFERGERFEMDAEAFSAWEAEGNAEKYHASAPLEIPPGPRSRLSRRFRER